MNMVIFWLKHLGWTVLLFMKIMTIPTSPQYSENWRYKIYRIDVNVVLDVSHNFSFKMFIRDSGIKFKKCELQTCCIHRVMHFSKKKFCSLFHSKLILCYSTNQKFINISYLVIQVFEIHRKYLAWIVSFIYHIFRLIDHCSKLWRLFIFIVWKCTFPLHAQILYLMCFSREIEHTQIC